MDYTSLYRKYRPHTFDQVIGQPAVVRTLRNMVLMDNAAHALLFTGPRGNGKTSLARIFARAVNCQSPGNGSPCGHCAACRSMQAAASVDIIELDAASNNGVDDIRALRETVQYPPADPDLRYKVYIIDEVHQLTSAAFNAFLKTLEEPPSYCIFILCTTEVQKLPATILSRCMRFDFRLMSQEDLVAHILDIYRQEGVSCTDDAAMAIARAGAGSVRDSLSVADTCMTAAGKEPITYELVLSVLGANNPAVIADMADALLHARLADALRVVDATVAAGKSVTVLARDVCSFLRDLLIVKNDATANEFLHMPSSVYETAKRIAADTDSTVIVRAMGIFSGLDSSMRYATTPRFILENAIARCTTAVGQDAVDIAARVSAVEQQVQRCAAQIAAAPRVTVATQSAPADTTAQTPVAETQPVDAGVVLEAVGGNVFAQEEPIRTLPDQAMASAGSAVKLKGELIAKLEQNKLMFLQVIFSNKSTNITIKPDSSIVVYLESQNDCDYCRDANDSIVRIVSEIVGYTPTIIYKHAASKRSSTDDINAFVDLFGAGNVTKK